VPGEGATGGTPETTREARRSRDLVPREAVGFSGVVRAV
jgi:hypothetical protein